MARVMPYTLKKRLTVEIRQEVFEQMSATAKRDRITVTELLKRGFALYQMAHEARADGKHVGVVSDRTALEREIIGLI